MTDQAVIFSLCRYLGHTLGGIIQRVDPYILGQIQEVRLRANRPVVLFTGKTQFFLQRNGEVSSKIEPQNYLLSFEELGACFRLFCEYSIHSFQEEIRQGFVTIQGGHRVGLCGTGILEKDKNLGMKDISGCNLRIARSQKGIADTLLSQVFLDRLCSCLIIGGVGSGKTTLIRDAVRQLGNGYLNTPVKIALIDERGEMAATHQGVAQQDVGIHTDVYHLYPKAIAMNLALRSLSPQLIACDEIGGEDDMDALLSCMNTGVYVLASAHGNTLEEVLRRKPIENFIKQGGFTKVAVLEGFQNPGKIRSVESVLPLRELVL